MLALCPLDCVTIAGYSSSGVSGPGGWLPVYKNECEWPPTIISISEPASFAIL